MPKAWLVRLHQRQEFLRKLIRMAREVEEGFEFGVPDVAAGQSVKQFFFTNLAVTIVTHLQPRIAARDSFAFQWFIERALPETRRFARSDKERDALFAEFLENYVLPEALVCHFRRLADEEDEYPEIIFHAEGAMAEVLFPEDD